MRSFATSMTLAAMSLGFAVVQLDVTIVNVAINAIGTSFGASLSALQWVVSAYTITFAALILSAGALGDRIGAKRLFMAGFTIFTGASLACALAPNLAMLIAARAVQGVGAAVLVPNSLALLNHVYREDGSRRRAVAIWAAGASLALTAGPLIGGALIAITGWRSIFLVNLPIGLVGLWLTARYAVETPRSSSQRLDWLGQTAAILALGCLGAASIESGPLGWSDPRIITGVIAAFASIAAFLWVERTVTHPMLPLSLFRNSSFAATSAVGLLVNAAFYGLIFVFSLYFQRIQHLSPLWTGIAFAPMTGAVLATNLVAARVTNLIGPRLAVAAGTAAVAVGCLALLGIRAGSNYWSLLLQLVAMGAGLGLLVPPLTSTLLASVPKTQSGIASGVLNSMRQTGSVIGVALLGSLIAQNSDFIAGTRMALELSALALAGACVAVLTGVHERTRH